MRAVRKLQVGTCIEQDKADRQLEITLDSIKRGLMAAKLKIAENVSLEINVLLISGRHDQRKDFASQNLYRRTCCRRCRKERRRDL